MDESLRLLNVTLSQVKGELRTTLAPELDVAHRITPDPDALPKRSMELENTLQHLKDVQDILTPPLHKVTEGIFAFATSTAVRTAVQYHVPDILASAGPLSTRELARQAGVSADVIRPLLHLLAHRPGVLSLEPVEGAVFGGGSSLSPSSINNDDDDDDDDDDVWSCNAAAHLLTRDHWTQWWRWADLYTTEFPDIVGRLPEAAAAGEARTAMHLACGASAAVPLYGVLAAQAWAPKFHAALGAGAVAMAPGMLADYPWGAIGDAVVCDLGGGAGDFLVALLRAWPRLRGALLDIVGTAALAEARIRRAEPDVRARVVAVHAGDFFIDVPAYPVYTIKWTLHNWGDPQAEEILRNVRVAMVPSAVSRLLVIDSVIVPGSWRSSPALYGSVVMSAGSKGGKERTETEWRRLASNAGWRVVEIYNPRGSIPCILDLRCIDEPISGL